MFFAKIASPLCGEARLAWWVYGHGSMGLLLEDLFPRQDWWAIQRQSRGGFEPKEFP